MEECNCKCHEEECKNEVLIEELSYEEACKLLVDINMINNAYRNLMRAYETMSELHENKVVEKVTVESIEQALDNTKVELGYELAHCVDPVYVMDALIKHIRDTEPKKECCICEG